MKKQYKSAALIDKNHDKKMIAEGIKHGFILAANLIERCFTQELPNETIISILQAHAREYEKSSWFGAWSSGETQP